MGNWEKKKIFTITLDNTRHNDRLLQHYYFLFDDSFICESGFLHVGCGAHELNLIVKVGLDVIDEVNYKIRKRIWK